VNTDEGRPARRSRWGPPTAEQQQQHQQQQQQQHYPLPPPPLRAEQHHRQPDPPPLPPAPPPAVGSVVPATVRAVKPFGVFVGLDNTPSLSALVHHSHVGDAVLLTRDDDDPALREKALAFVCPPGERVFVKVLSVAAAGEGPGGGGRRRVQASMRVVDQATGEDLDPDGSRAALIDGRGGGGGGGGGPGPSAQSGPMPKEGDVLRGAVQRVEPFGAFVALPGLPGRRLALVHASELSDHMPRFAAGDTPEARREAVAGVVAVGDEVWVKVIEVAEGAAGGGGGGAGGGGRLGGGDEDDGGDAAAGVGGQQQQQGQPPRQQLRVSCSMRLASQADGTDLDPDGSQLERRRRRGGPRAAAGAGAGAEGGGGARRHGGAGAVVRGGVIDWAHERGSVKQYVADPAADGGGARGAAAAGAAAAPHDLLAADDDEATGEVEPAGGGGEVDDPEARALGISTVEEALAVLRAAERAKKEGARGRERGADRGERRRRTRSPSRSRSRSRSRDRDRGRKSSRSHRRSSHSRSRSREGRRRRSGGAGDKHRHHPHRSSADERRRGRV